MTRRRRAVRVLSILSVLLAVAVVALWVRSGGRQEFVGHETVVAGEKRSLWRLGGVWSQDGQLMFGTVWTDTLYRMAVPNRPGGLVYIANANGFWAVNPARRTPRSSGPMARLGFYWNSYEVSGLWGYSGHRLLCVPHWFVALVAGAPAYPWLARVPAAVRQWRGVSKLRRGLCPVCGYDVRATPDQCPECGGRARALPPPAPARLVPAASRICALLSAAVFALCLYASVVFAFSILPADEARELFYLDTYVEGLPRMHLAFLLVLTALLPGVRFVRRRRDEADDHRAGADEPIRASAG
jgi:hypothetical protein